MVMGIHEMQSLADDTLKETPAGEESQLRVEGRDTDDVVVGIPTYNEEIAIGKEVGASGLEQPGVIRDKTVTATEFLGVV